MSRDNKNRFNIVFRFFLHIFTLIGFVFVMVFFAMQFNLLNVKGSTSERNSYFDVKKKNNNESNQSLKIICRINLLGKYAPFTAANIYKTLMDGTDEPTIEKMINVASKRFENYNSFRLSANDCENSEESEVQLPMSAYNWADTDQWNLLKEVFTRDQEIINRAARDAGVSPRILLGGVIGEQLRFFNNRRESFKGYFEPLKILASLSNVSFGIAGLKPKTAELIEQHLKDRNSQFYLGYEKEGILDYPLGVDIESERMSRITNAKDPYYSYLYVGLFLKQVEAQWRRAGYDISKRPDILATLYNLGFPRSVPKSNARPGGAVITVNEVDYTFGDLGYEFYYSGEMIDIFPLNLK